MPVARDLSWQNLKQAASNRLGHGGSASSSASPSGGKSQGTGEEGTAQTGVVDPNATPTMTSSRPRGPTRASSNAGSTYLASTSEQQQQQQPQQRRSSGPHLAVPNSESQSSFSSASLSAVQSGDSSGTASQSTSTGQPGAASTPPKPQVLALLRIQVLRASNLTPMDRNGKADPFVSVSIPGLASLGASRGQSQQNSDAFKRQTAVMPKTLSPEWKNEVWDFEITEEWFGSLGWQGGLDTEEGDVLVDEPGDMADGDEAIEGEQDEMDDANAQVAGLQIQQEPKVSETTSARSLRSGAEVAGAAGEGASTPVLSRPPSRRMLSSTASKVLATSAKGIKLLPKGAAAGARAVARGTPRPIRIRRRGSRNLSPARQLTGQSTGRGLVSNLEIVVWDKDFARREYMGEASWPVWAWCRGRNVEWPTATEDVNDGVWLSLVSSRRSTSVSGKVQVRLGLVPVPGSPVKSLERLYRRLVTSAVGTTARAGDQQTVLTTDTTVNEDDIRAGVRAIPASQSVGTGERFFADNGFSSDEDEEQEEVLDSDDSESDDDDDDEDDVDDEGTESDVDASGTGTEAESSTNEAEADADFLSKHKDRLRRGQRASSGDAEASQLPSGASTPGASTAGSNSPQHSHNIHSTRSRRKIWRGLGRKSATPDKSSSADSDLLLSKSGSTKGKRLSGRGKKTNQDGSAIPNVGNAKKIRRMQRRMERRERKREARAASQDYSFKSSSDIIGIVMMEIKKASDLPRWRNSMRTGFDMDPFTIVAFGQKVFRTRVLRHTLNPVWEEKLLFHVHQHEDNYRIKMSIYDWDKLTANDNVGSCELSMAALMDGAPKADPKTGLYPQTEQEQTKLQTFDLNLTRVGKDEDVKYGESSPVLQVRANFTPYAALRQRFWRQLCQQFDTNDSGSLSVLEITSMLDSLGSTLSQETIASFFTRFGKAAHADDLTLDEAIIALEAETQKSPKDKKSVTPAPALGETLRDVKDTSANVDKSGDSVMDVSGPGAHAPAIHVQGSDDEGPNPIPHSVIAGRDATDEPVSKALTEDQVDLRRVSSDPEQQPPSPLAYSGGESPPSDTQQDSRPVERLILLKSCPLCHMPRLSKKADGDVVTHLAVCASQDWRRVDSLVVSNFVTASQAHRKWFNKVVITATQGKYKLGVNSANIIVQDRETGELLEEKMQVYVRLGIRLLYQGARSRMEGARVRKMLKNMSVKQGRKYDSPASAREIAGFIAFHNLNVDEIRDPLDSFKTFNQFFYRKLKPTARPITEPKNPNRLVSSADCRLMVFPSIDAATTIWVKGREFSVDRLLGDDYRDRKADYAQGTLCIFRLAPQDYHRFHCPADAVVKSIRHIEGALYTVNPMSIRSAIDVYGENSRTIVEFESNEFGTFYAVNVGAMLVGSIIITVQEGQTVKRGDEMGYYAFGGSTTILVFAKGYVEWDEDIEANSNAAIETLVKQGTGIGRRSGANVG